MFVAYAQTATVVASSASLVDRLIESLVIMVIGMGAVFLMLTISMFGMMLIGKIAAPKEEPVVSEVSTTSAPSASTAKISASIEDDTDAEIAAAVALIHHIRRKSAVNIPVIVRRDI